MIYPIIVFHSCSIDSRLVPNSGQPKRMRPYRFLNLFRGIQTSVIPPYCPIFFIHLIFLESDKVFVKRIG